LGRFGHGVDRGGGNAFWGKCLKPFRNRVYKPPAH
jgi:hypothetical protein